MVMRREILFGMSATTLSTFLLPCSFARSLGRFSNSEHSLNPYQIFLQQIYTSAIQQGMNPEIIRQALSLSQPNERAIELDRKQPEFNMTWDEYRQKVVSEKKIQDGKSVFSQLEGLLTQIWERYQVDPRIVVGIWGIESAYGKHMGKFHVIDVLATLAYEGRRAKFFRSELIKALSIVNNGDVDPGIMMGSYAGAMGQSQFMPSAYLQYAVDFSGTGKRNIWTNQADVLASIANYLSRCGWDVAEPWGQPIRMNTVLPTSEVGRKRIRSLEEWEAMGVRREDGSLFTNKTVQGAVIQPDGAQGESYMVYHNFHVIRRYNPSDYYALAVGLLGNALA